MIIQMVRDEAVAYHAKGSASMLPDWLKVLQDPVFCSRLNGYTIGIEIELLKTDADGAYTDAQYEALASLLAKLCDLYDIPYDREHIITHASVQSDRRDPRGFDWARVGL